MIDLSKIKAGTKPTKNIEVRVRGVKMIQKITPITGEARLRYWTLGIVAKTDDDNTLKRFMIALVKGAGMTEEDASALIEIDWIAARTLASAIHSFTEEYEAAIGKETEDAEKNSGTPDPATDSAV